MKTQINLFFLLLGVLFIYSCNPTAPAPSPATLKQADTISIATYNNWQGAWMEKGQAYTDVTLTEYFTMPLIDLTEFSATTHTAARFVLGLDTTIVPPVPHLMLVGVDANGASMLPPTYPNASIYDVTRPCPDLCGPKSIAN